MPFTYVKNSDDSPEFARDLQDFIKVCVVRTSNKHWILPKLFCLADFGPWSLQRGELLGVSISLLSPVPIQEVVAEEKSRKSKNNNRINCNDHWLFWNQYEDISARDLEMVATLKGSCKHGRKLRNAMQGSSVLDGLTRRNQLILPYASCHYKKKAYLCLWDGCPWGDLELLVGNRFVEEHRAIFADVNCRHQKTGWQCCTRSARGLLIPLQRPNRSYRNDWHFVFDYPGSVAFRRQRRVYAVSLWVRDNDTHYWWALVKGSSGPFSRDLSLSGICNLVMEFQTCWGALIFITLRRSEKCNCRFCTSDTKYIRRATRPFMIRSKKTSTWERINHGNKR